mgnify:CR=1
SQGIFAFLIPSEIDFTAHHNTRSPPPPDDAYGLRNPNVVASFLFFRLRIHIAIVTTTVSTVNVTTFANVYISI